MRFGSHGKRPETEDAVRTGTRDHDLLRGTKQKRVNSYLNNVHVAVNNTCTKVRSLSWIFFNHGQLIRLIITFFLAVHSTAMVLLSFVGFIYRDFMVPRLWQ